MVKKKDLLTFAAVGVGGFVLSRVLSNTLGPEIDKATKKESEKHEDKPVRIEEDKEFDPQEPREVDILGALKTIKAGGKPQNVTLQEIASGKAGPLNEREEDILREIENPPPEPPERVNPQFEFFTDDLGTQSVIVGIAGKTQTFRHARADHFGFISRGNHNVLIKTPGGEVQEVVQLEIGGNTGFGIRLAPGGIADINKRF